MKKILLSLAMALAVAPAVANDYTDNLVVSINGVETPAQTNTITVIKSENGAYDFLLSDFSFMGLSLGNIELTNVPGVEQNNVVYLADSSSVNVTLMPSIPPITCPVILRAELLNNSTKLYASMDIDVAAMGQKVNVLFGDAGYQLPNSGFEAFHTETLHSLAYDDNYNPIGWDTDTLKQAQVPNAWHSFIDASGWQWLAQYDDNYNVTGYQYVDNPTLAYMASSMIDPHTYISDEVRPGSTGKHSAKVVARNVMFGIIANGTITTGRMNAGSMQADSVANHAWLDLSSTDVDANGDPFYTVINGRPDSLTVWVKYGQGTPNAEHPYATVSAAITDGTYYQEPDTVEFNNVYAIARNNKIESTNGQWQQIKIPFEVKDANVDAKAIMVTISTNADPGAGSDGDSILVDDIHFVYSEPKNVQINFGGNSTSVGADDITATWEGANDAIVVKDIKQDGDNVVATVTVYNGDLTKQVAKQTHTYTNATVNGISNVKENAGSSKIVEAYDLSGRRVNTMSNGNVYIVKTADGKTFKIAK